MTKHSLDCSGPCYGDLAHAKEQSMGCSWRGRRRRHGQVWAVASTSSWLAFLFVFLSCVPASAQQTVRVGVYDNPPKVAVGETGTVSGLYPALLEHIAAAEGWVVEYVPGTWTESMARLDRGEIDLMVDVAYTAPRRELYAFNEETVLVNWGTVYSRPGLKILSLPELEGLRIAVMRGSTHTVDPGGIVDLVARFNILCTFVELDDYIEVFQALASGEADAGVVNRVFGLTFEEEFDVERTPIVFNPIELRFALPFDGPLTPLLISRIDHRLADYKRDPDSVYYQELEEHLLAIPKRQTVIRWPSWLLPGLFAAGTIITVLIVAVLLVRREVSHRTRAEEAYRRSEERFKLAMRGATDGLWDWNVRTGEVYYSQRWASMLGYDVDELEPTIETFLDLIHPDDLERVRANEYDYLSGSIDQYQIEFRMRHREGKHVDVYSRAFLVRDDRGTPVRIVGTHVDITDRKQAALELQGAKEKAEAADRLKSAFLATMSHELRTPLNSIIGFTGILLQELAGPLTAEQAKQLGMVQTSARHLLDLINDVLDISKIEAGQLEVVSEPFDLSDLILEMANAARPMAAEKGLGLQVDIGPGIGVVRSDRRRVGQIVMNLLSNAVKFTETGSVQIGCVEDGANVVITVKDTGIGISEEDIAKLFVPFQQIDTGLTRKYEGTGLGLSICKRLSEKMGGRIAVESELGRGSRFTVWLPKGS